MTPALSTKTIARDREVVVAFAPGIPRGARTQRRRAEEAPRGRRESVVLLGRETSFGADNIGTELSSFTCVLASSVGSVHACGDHFNVTLLALAFLRSVFAELKVSERVPTATVEDDEDRARLV